MKHEWSAGEAIFLDPPSGRARYLSLCFACGLLCLDVMLGGRLQLNTVFGYTPTVAGRFAGLGNLAFALVHAKGLDPVVGASGAIAGLYAGASRLIRPGGPGLAPLNNPTVVGMGAAWITINLVIGLFGIDPGFGAAGAKVAWEAHIGGYLAGILLIDLFDRAAPGVRFQRRKD